MVTPPKHLSRESKKMWRSILEEYEIADIAGLRILRVALEAFDRSQKCRESIDDLGLTIKDKFGQQKPHPLLPMERDSRAAFLAGIKALNLDIEPLGRAGRK
jgi:P27 family predicted phage terminase small subunit